MLLQALINEGNMARYAAVCQEWRASIENLNFHSLKLTARDIPSFGKLTTQHRNLVKYIWFSIEFLSYDCTECDLDETESVMEANRITIMIGMFQAEHNEQRMKWASFR